MGWLGEALGDAGLELDFERHASGRVVWLQMTGNSAKWCFKQIGIFFSLVQ